MWQSYGDSNLHIVFGDTRNDSWTSINSTGWRTVYDPSLTYWLSISSELGAQYSPFGNGYVPYNIIVGPGYQMYLTGSGFSEAEATAAIDAAMANADLYPVEMVDDILAATGQDTYVDLSTAFFNNTGQNIVFSISENSAPALLDISFDGNTMIITGKTEIGAANITLQASAGTNTSYLKFSTEVYNPDMTASLTEGYEEVWPPAGWTLDTSGAGFVRSSSDSHSGTFSAVHMDDTGDQDDWMISPLVSITDTSVLSFWQKGLYDSYYTYHGVGLSVDMRRFEILASDLHAADAWEKIYVDLSSWAGKDAYIGFQYVGNYSDVWLIDDIELLSVTNIEDDTNISGIELFQNYPNPFNPSTDISFSIDKSSDIKLSVFNSKGELVRSIHEGSISKGYHSFTFDASDLNSGIYFYTLEAENNKFSKKMILLK